MMLLCRPPVSESLGYVGEEHRRDVRWSQERHREEMHPRIADPKPEAPVRVALRRKRPGHVAVLDDLQPP